MLAASAVVVLRGHAGAAGRPGVADARALEAQADTSGGAAAPDWGSISPCMVALPRPGSGISPPAISGPATPTPCRSSDLIRRARARQPAAGADGDRAIHRAGHSAGRVRGSRLARCTVADAADHGRGTQLGVALPNFLARASCSSSCSPCACPGCPRAASPGWEHGAAGPPSARCCCPRLALALPQAAILARVTRSGGAGGTARRGLPAHRPRPRASARRAALWRHAVPNALIPVVTILGLQFSFLLAGTDHHRERVHPPRAWAGWCSRPSPSAT